MTETLMHQDLASLFDLKGKVAMITGGASFLGYDAAEILAAAGADIIITSRNGDKAEKSARDLRTKFNSESIGIALDQTDFTSVQSCFAIAYQWKNRMDILVNNAGGGAGATLSDLFQRNADDIRHLIELNLTGMVYCCKEAGKIMHDQKSGKIINIASIAGLLGRDRKMYERSHMNGQAVDYAAAKAGVIGLTKDLAGFLSPSGINVNSISPGGFTGPDRNHAESFVQDYSARTPLGRMGRDGIDIKGTVLFLASPASDYITGHNLVVDGGFSIWH